MKITPREAVILAALMDGPKTNDELGQIAGCCREGVRKHVANIRSKLPAGGLGRVTAYALSGEAPKAVSKALARCVAA